jgi:hypothetical protein
MVWEINDNGELETCQYQFDNQRKQEIIDSLDGVNCAYAPKKKLLSILDMMLE